jgi:phenylacetic acid degradation operon negative regulatory protein
MQLDSTQLGSTLPPLNAKALLLDLLRMVQPLSLPVSLLVDAGRVLSINENAIRVNITRLLAKEQIEQDERGYYRLGKESEPFGEWLKQWQAGERRVKVWNGSYLLLNTSRGLSAKSEQAVFRVAHHLGFREMMKGSWLRPNNLNRDVDSLVQQIASLSRVEDFFVIEVSHLHHPKGSSLSLIESLWNAEELQQQYQKVLKVLEEGIKQFSKLSVEEAFRDSYFVGAEVHHRLALDPLLPDTFIDSSLRQAVIEQFSEYDKTYRPAWLQFFEGHVLKMTERKFDSLKMVNGF